MKKISKNVKKKTALIVTIVTMVLLVLIVGISYAVYQREEEVTFINAKVGDFRVNLSNITSTSTNTTIDLSYTASGYNASTTCTFGTVKGTYNIGATTVNNSKCTKTGLTQNTAYYYKVCTKNKLNQESCREGSINTKYNAPTLSNITATSTINSINLSYTMSGTISSRTCKYGTSNGNYSYTVSNPTNSKCSITGLKENTTYYCQVCGSNSGGENCKTGSIATKKKTIADEVNIGDYISMTPTLTSYKIATTKTGYTSAQTINPSELNLWRVIRKNSDGTVDMVSHYTSSKEVYFKGKEGYINYIGTLNEIAALYTNANYVYKTRHIGYSNQTEVITDTSKLSQATVPWTRSTSVDNKWTGCDASSYLCGTDENLGAGDIGYETNYNLVKGVYGSMTANKVGAKTSTSYWLASRRFLYYSTTSWNFCGRGVSASGGLYNSLLYNYVSGFDSIRYSSSVRPIVTLKSSAEKSSGSGTESSPYILK